ncbi:hypothetical protein M378DRAFT_17933 [Amanita muscaria Koide BX008]|uniref:Uncharacterized protein n=1 Tax=Amanita muscaria (strain Koide BX008) TaxID=946122 RepID=A0A0C2WFS9_AMAMK|nr:hypothetical protein M378DRAFT_17933 [Amanita muscaria Koide BX008]
MRPALASIRCIIPSLWVVIIQNSAALVTIIDEQLDALNEAYCALQTRTGAPRHDNGLRREKRRFSEPSRSSEKMQRPLQSCFARADDGSAQWVSMSPQSSFVVQDIDTSSGGHRPVDVLCRKREETEPLKTSATRSESVIAHSRRLSSEALLSKSQISTDSNAFAKSLPSLTTQALWYQQLQRLTRFRSYIIFARQGEQSKTWEGWQQSRASFTATFSTRKKP